MTSRRRPAPGAAVVVPLARRTPVDPVLPHRHDWRITEIDFAERPALHRLDCDCGATDYRAV